MSNLGLTGLANPNYASSDLKQRAHSTECQEPPNTITMTPQCAPHTGTPKHTRDCGESTSSIATCAPDCGGTISGTETRVAAKIIEARCREHDFGKMRVRIRILPKFAIRIRTMGSKTQVTPFTNPRCRIPSNEIAVAAGQRKRTRTIVHAPQPERGNSRGACRATRSRHITQPMPVDS